ncbi:MAG: plasma-membrane proton-efflux P-type ATPase [Crenarchaeota archaeon]|nr:plasma-membrane proton-efflux P-type ATPase [Thermoproteota archaeon]
MENKPLDARNITNIPVDQLFTILSTNESGLSSVEVHKRLSKFGANEIIERKVNPIKKFLGYFWGPIPWMIEAAVIMSAVIQHWPDFAIILALLMLNAVVGFWQENKAGNAIELLKQKLALTARVLRDGKWVQKPAKELVPGDVVRVRLGDIIPADVKLINGDYIQADESALTGESLPVEKHVNDVGYSGSIVRQGEMDALVVATGMNTYFGKTTTLVEKAGTKSHFQKAVTKIGDYLIALALILVVIIIITSLLRAQSLLSTIQFALVLTVAAIPAALPAVLSVTLALGAIVLARKEAIVSKLVAIEEMAGVDVLCVDKTGTITENKLTVSKLEPLDAGVTEHEVLLYASLASREEDQDPIDNAVIGKTKYNVEVRANIQNYKIVRFTPFNPIIKRTEAKVLGKKGETFQVSKGAPQVILSLVSNKETMAGKVNEAVAEFAKNGYRALGVAKTNDRGDWVYVGLIALHDPPREDSAKTLKTAYSMGLKVKMVTGDHEAIAKEIASEVGLGTNIMDASSFLDKSDLDAQQLILKADGFAEVFPEHKFRIVKLLQRQSHIVAMTGDGVNDAPALKQADAGIAVADATDAARSAADIVLTKPGLSVIIDALKQSRQIFRRMTNYSIYRISETFRVLFFITSAILVFNLFPVTALMIVLLAILNDLPVITIAYDNVRYSTRPEKWDMRKILGIASFIGVIGVFSSFGLLYIGLEVLKLDPLVLQSFIYLKLSVAGHLTIFMARTKGHFWSVRPAKPLLLAVIGTQIVATLITVYGILLPAMGWSLAAIVWGYALLMFVLTDFAKVALYKRFAPR